MILKLNKGSNLSHKTTVKTKLNNLFYIEKALKDMKCEYQIAEEGQTLKTGGNYSNTYSDVDILITKVNDKNTKGAIGLKKQKDGTYQAIGDFWDAGLNASSFKGDLVTGAKKSEVIDRLRRKGFKLSGQSKLTEKGKNLNKFTFTRWV